MNGREFRFQFAIRMPNGHLYSEPLKNKAERVTYGTMLSALMGFDFMETQMMPTVDEPEDLKMWPRIFDTEAEAQKLLAELQDRAAAVGVPYWGGAVVKSLCTPFTTADPANEFVTAIQAFVQKETQ